MTQKFIHAADFHLDSPLAGIKKLSPEAAKRLRGATRRAVEKIVSLARNEQVAAVVIAGDLFDGPVRDSSSAIWLEGQFRKLAADGIQVVLIQGNHDAYSNAGKSVKWSEGIKQLRSDAPETFVIEEAGLAIHGQSFAARSVQMDLAAEYPPAVEGYFNIGVLHTSLSGNADHDDYAPTTVSVLDGKGYNYWALGHIHARSVESLSRQAYVGYSGCIQGRHIREPGAKGVNLVTVQDGEIETIEFVSTDSIRWHHVRVDVSAASRVIEIEPIVREAVRDVVEREAAQEMAFRVELTGQTCLHRELSDRTTQAQLGEVLADSFREIGDVWLERVKVKTLPDIARADASVDVPLQYVSRVVEQIAESDVVREELEKALDELLKRAKRDLPELVADLSDESQVSGGAALKLEPIVAEAASLLTAGLLEGQEDEA